MDHFLPYLSSKSGSPGAWLNTNKTALLKFIDDAEHLDHDDKTICSEYINSPAVYKHLVIHFYQVLKSHYDKTRLAKLKNSMITWANWDTLIGLHRHELVIDYFRSFPGWNKTPHLKSIIALDIDALCARLFNIIYSRSHYRDLSNLKDQEAQAVLNLMQTILDTPFLDPCFRNPFVGGLLRLSEKSGLVPETLIRDGVTVDAGYSFATGAFGELYTGSLNGEVIAIKFFKSNHRNDHDATKHLKMILRETLIWRQLKHPHVLPFIGIYYHTNSHLKIGLVSPWMKHGNVRDFLHQTPDANRTSLISDIAEGLSYLHSTQPRIIHGDLKAANVLITNDQTACIADLGLSRALHSDIVSFSSLSNGRGSGSVRWMAPELFDQDDDAELSSDTMTDVYALGFVCYEIFSGCIPFHRTTFDLQVVSRIIVGQRPERPVLSEPSQQTCISLGLSDQLWDLIENCWDPRPEHRPTVGEVVDRLPKRPGTTSASNDAHLPLYMSATSAGEDVIAWAMSHPRYDVNMNFPEEDVPQPALPLHRLNNHPQVGQSRPNAMDDYLRTYQLFFVVDDSTYMQHFLWNRTRDALLDLADLGLKLDTPCINIGFFNSPCTFYGVKGRNTITSIFEEVQPKGRTRTGAALRTLLDDHIKKLNSTINTPKYTTMQPLDIVVLTDGVPFEGDKTMDVLLEAEAHVKAANHDPHSVSVLIVQIGNDPEAAKYFRHLSQNIDMVDVKLYDPFHTPNALEMLLLSPRQLVY